MCIFIDMVTLSLRSIFVRSIQEKERNVKLQVMLSLIFSSSISLLIHGITQYNVTLMIIDNDHFS